MRSSFSENGRPGSTGVRGLVVHCLGLALLVCCLLPTQSLAAAPTTYPDYPMIRQLRDVSPRHRQLWLRSRQELWGFVDEEMV